MDLGGLLSAAPAAVDTSREQSFDWRLRAAGRGGPVQQGPLAKPGAIWAAAAVLPERGEAVS